MLYLNLDKVEKKLDKVRLSLWLNLESRDDDREETWESFIVELNELKKLLDQIPEDSDIAVCGVIE